MYILYIYIYSINYCKKQYSKSVTQGTFLYFVYPYPVYRDESVLGTLSLCLRLCLVCILVFLFCLNHMQKEGQKYSSNSTICVEVPTQLVRQSSIFIGVFPNPPTYIDLSEASLWRSVTQAAIFRSQLDQMSFKGDCESLRKRYKYQDRFYIGKTVNFQVTYNENSASVVGKDKTEL